MRSYFWIIIGIGIGLPALTGAQQQPPVPAEPRLPANPQSPTDFQSTTNAPGMPQPTGTPTSPSPPPVTPPPPASPSGLPEGGGGGARGYQGGDMSVEGGDATLYGGGQPARNVPPYHEVKKGDTLWDICDHYYADPWSWPQVWAYNKQITNPHWIYPGDQVRLLGAPTFSGRTGRPERAEMLRLTGRARGLEPGAVQIRQNAFIEPKELQDSGNVAGSPAERIMLSNLDEMYVEGTDKWQPQRGQYYTVYRVRQELKDSKGKNVGYQVEILGTAQVRTNPNDKKVATAVITEALAPIERGHRVGPLRRRFTRVPVRPAQENIEAEVIATARPGKYVSTEDIVFLGSGRNQGVQEGHRFLVVRRGDGYKRLLQQKDDNNPKYPQETVAEITVLEARDNSSVGLITRATKEVTVGDKVRMRRGY